MWFLDESVQRLYIRDTQKWSRATFVFATESPTLFSSRTEKSKLKTQRIKLCRFLSDCVTRIILPPFNRFFTFGSARHFTMSRELQDGASVPANAFLYLGRRNPIFSVRINGSRGFSHASARESCIYNRLTRTDKFLYALNNPEISPTRQMPTYIFSCHSWESQTMRDTIRVALKRTIETYISHIYVFFSSEWILISYREENNGLLEFLSCGWHLPINSHNIYVYNPRYKSDI